MFRLSYSSLRRYLRPDFRSLSIFTPVGDGPRLERPNATRPRLAAHVLAVPGGALAAHRQGTSLSAARSACERSERPRRLRRAPESLHLPLRVSPINVGA